MKYISRFAALLMALMMVVGSAGAEMPLEELTKNDLNRMYLAASGAEDVYYQTGVLGATWPFNSSHAVAWDNQGYALQWYEIDDQGERIILPGETDTSLTVTYTMTEQRFVCVATDEQGKTHDSPVYVVQAQTEDLEDYLNILYNDYEELYYIPEAPIDAYAAAAWQWMQTWNVTLADGSNLANLVTDYWLDDPYPADLLCNCAGFDADFCVLAPDAKHDRMCGWNTEVTVTAGESTELVIDVPEEAFFQKPEVNVQHVWDEQILAAVEAAIREILSGATLIDAFDISFMDAAGETVKPAKDAPVTLVFTIPTETLAIQQNDGTVTSPEDLVVMHMKENDSGYKAERVGYSLTVNPEKEYQILQVEASEFSIYVVAAVGQNNNQTKVDSTLTMNVGETRVLYSNYEPEKGTAIDYRWEASETNNNFEVKWDAANPHYVTVTANNEGTIKLNFWCTVKETVVVETPEDPDDTGDGGDTGEGADTEDSDDTGDDGDTGESGDTGETGESEGTDEEVKTEEITKEENVESITVRAVKQLQVSFEANEGTGGPYQVDVFNRSFTFPKLEDTGIEPPKGARFGGWGTQTGNNGDTYAADIQGTADKDGIKYYAQWFYPGTGSIEAGWQKAYFFVRKNGVIQPEPASYASADYYPKTDYTETSTNFGYIYTAVEINNNLEAVNANVAQAPSVENMKTWGIENYNSETQEVIWYVIKKQSNGNWHVDGVLWDKDKFEVSYHPNGGNNNYPGSNQHAVGSTVKVNYDTRPNRAGYIFRGWDENPNAESPTYNCDTHTPASFVMPPNKVELYAIWRPSDATPYTVEHYLCDVNGENPRLASEATQTMYGTTGQTVTAGYLTTFAGYEAYPEHKDRISEGTIEGAGSLVLKLYYRLVCSTLTIKKTGMSTEAGESAIFEVKAYTKAKGDAEQETFIVAVPNGENVVIGDLLIGKGYTVTEITDWTWRYTSTESATGTIVATGSMVAFANSEQNDKWLSDESSVTNNMSSGYVYGHNNE